MINKILKLKINQNIIIILSVLIFSCAENFPSYEISSLNVTGSIDNLNIVTWNIENFPKNNLTANYVKNIIDSMQVDILALQEIRNLTSLNNIASDLGDNWIAYRSPGSSNYGNLAYLINTDELDNLSEPYLMGNDYYLCPEYTANIIDHRCLYEESIDYAYNFASRMPYIIDFEYNNEFFTLINLHLKCCGDPNGSEESRRYEAIKNLYDYINNNLSNRNIIILGDLNDDIGSMVNFDGEPKGIFYLFEEDEKNSQYLFTDRDISDGSLNNWSYPNYPSHIDHIIINNKKISLQFFHYLLIFKVQ